MIIVRDYNLLDFSLRDVKCFSCNNLLDVTEQSDYQVNINDSQKVSFIYIVCPVCKAEISVSHKLRPVIKEIIFKENTKNDSTIN